MTDTTDAPARPAAGAQPHLGWALVVISLAQLMVVLDGTITNIALPYIGRDLAIEPANVLDLSNTLRRRGERNPLGAKTAVARFFGRELKKSKSITTTNWALPRLSEKQILYAADDAHVALRLYRHWQTSRTPA